MGRLAQRVADPELLDRDIGHDGERRGEEDAHEAEEEGEDDDGEERQHRWQMDGPPLHQGGHEVAFDLLQHDVEAEHPEHHLPVLVQGNQQGRHRGHDRAQDRHELGEPGEDRQGQGRRHADQPEAGEGGDENEGHDQELAL